MHLSNKIRVVGAALLLFVISSWLWICNFLLGDYLALLNHDPIVRLSVITLWVPIGAMGVLLCMLVMSPKALFRGKKINEVYSPRAMQLANKVCVYFALAGIAFAAGWTYHTLDLLEQYGYVYSRDLTKITPTGIHLMYVLSN
ncbi:hypothetical protein KY019_002685 [Vibrio cholerae]|nr:hypothetical protein [Vibrio cholerae]EHU0384304.1 hypothetical protein [Vibrio cholerae]EJL6669259.1 hypothetical protein [Vibrio cholerae]EKF9153879.1 hypothetical protein [Vibrio cholerae]ELN6874045.1 hypothetical protein [Vibrio cholerae]